MATYWHKPDYLPTDRDPVTHEILPGAMPPGIYCGDKADMDALIKGASAKGIPAGLDFQGELPFSVTMAGHAVYIATPAQAELLRAMPATFPADHLAQQQAAFDAYDAAAAQVAKLEAWARTFATMTYEEAVAEDRLMTRARVRQAMRGMAGEEYHRAFMRHAPAWGNRAARRAAAAKERRS